MLLRTCWRTGSSPAGFTFDDKKTSMEQLESFGLPETFPAHLMPPKGAQLVRDCVKGISKAALMRLARQRGFKPTLKPLEHMGPGVYGFGLTIDGCVVPLMVRMRTVGSLSRATPALEQGPLF
jgi:hypothetical protein